MVLDQAIKEVQQISGWRSDKIVEITAALGYAQTELERPGMSFPWWLKKTGALTTIASTVTYSIPTDFIQEAEEVEGDLYYLTQGTVNSRTIFLKKMDFKAAQQFYYGVWPYVINNPPSAIIDQSIPFGAPTSFCLTESQLILYPVPDNVYNLTWKYYATQPAQATGQENAWLKNAPWVLIGMAAKKICSDIGYAEGVTSAMGILSDAQPAMFRSVIAREESGRRRKMGSRS